MNNTLDIIQDSEKVARLIDNEWVVNGKLQLSAFALRPKETYISVNRLTIPSYKEDVYSFVNQHPSFLLANNSYQRALMLVNDIRHIVIEIEGEILGVDVVVEARAKNIRSHAGIFVRYGGQNVKNDTRIIIQKQQLGVSSDDILLDVRMSLLKIATLESCNLS
ncbi:MAG: hypothetical protein IKP73_12310 [Bacteroidales bacterium]|nr:hypothetical protein [Bacteroidales bacterium]